MAEFELINELLKPLASDPGAFSLTDDAAVLTPQQGQEVVLTKDVMVEGVHFLPGTDPASLAQKLLRVNLSDLAAMGASPRGYLLGLQLPTDGARDWLSQFVQGLVQDQKTFDLSLLGGDTVGTPGPLSLSLTAIGQVPTGTALRRNGATPGEGVFVSGTIGDGALGLRVAKGELTELSDVDRTCLLERLELPTPRLKLGAVLRGAASAAADISDGLIADAGHIAEASDVVIKIDADRVPLTRAATRALEQGLTTLSELITGGDDYEILFTAPLDAVAPLEARDDLPEITQVGWVREGEPSVKAYKGGQKLSLSRTGFTHL